MLTFLNLVNDGVDISISKSLSANATVFRFRKDTTYCEILVSQSALITTPDSKMLESSIVEECLYELIKEGVPESRMPICKNSVNKQYKRGATFDSYSENP